MAQKTRSRLAVVIIVAGSVGIGRPAQASPIQSLTISLLVVDQVGVAPTVLARAEAEATRIYQATGIKLMWTDGSHGTPAFQFGVKIVAIPFAAKDVDRRALGVAPGTTTIRGSLAYAFYGRILDFTTAHNIDLGVMLGYVIAHEVGHLLLPYNSHSKAGLMSGAWDERQALRATQGALAFSAEESLAMRAGLETRRN